MEKLSGRPRARALDQQRRGYDGHIIGSRSNPDAPNVIRVLIHSKHMQAIRFPTEQQAQEFALLWTRAAREIRTQHAEGWQAHLGQEATAWLPAKTLHCPHCQGPAHTHSHKAGRAPFDAEALVDFDAAFARFNAASPSVCPRLT